MIRSQLPRRPRRPPRCAKCPPFSRANSGAPNSACTHSPFPFRSCVWFCRGPRAMLCEQAFATPSSLPRRCAPKGCVCAHTFDIAMREERDAPPRGEAAPACVCVANERSNGGTNAGGCGRSVGVASASAPSLFCMRTYPPCAHAHPTPRSPLHRSLSLSPHCSLSLCRVGISGRAP